MAIEMASAALSTRLQRTPTDADLAAELAMNAGELDAALRRVADARLISLDQPWSAAPVNGAGRTGLAAIAAHGTGGLHGDELRERIAEAIGSLPDREQLILALRYQQQLSFFEVGEILGLQESRVSRLHAKAVLGLRARLSQGLASVPR
jgi:RNA polymerase sigma factor for flagellar operon FliA